MNRRFAIFLGTLLCGVVPVAVHAQSGKQASSGVYTAEQATRGAALYQSKCAECHGPDLAGGGTSPALVGSDFSTSWSGKPVATLFNAIHTSMPSDRPGSLTLQQTADVVAFLLKVNSYPAGKTELPTDADRLKSILIDSIQ